MKQLTEVSISFVQNILGIYITVLLFYSVTSRFVTFLNIFMLLLVSHLALNVDSPLKISHYNNLIINAIYRPPLKFKTFN